ncbi:hypothetical protein KIN20_024466 [Parelaphostrongylus tenuis]|uniref:Uncharacterized protein n=1 Tax=Parelaphostrongylus tenuis TaxID=148309 RepID=A0AAD5QWR5_PARTN|nr:hypothetical protein KIN20_024466 [Parelaphostrongylus tenuis]
MELNREQKRLLMLHKYKVGTNAADTVRRINEAWGEGARVLTHFITSACDPATFSTIQRICQEPTVNGLFCVVDILIEPCDADRHWIPPVGGALNGNLELDIFPWHMLAPNSLQLNHFK